MTALRQASVDEQLTDHDTLTSHPLLQGVGESIVQYVEENRMSLVVLGSRGMGSIKR